VTGSPVAPGTVAPAAYADSVTGRPSPTRQTRARPDRGTSLSHSIRLSSVAVNCPDAAELAAFYADITGGRIDFQTVPDHTPPTWPGSTSPNRLHLDFLVDDLAATEARVLAAGATRYQFQPNAEHCLVFADPAGHPFCLTTLEELG
jgi:Glyoxalase-like domain